MIIAGNWKMHKGPKEAREFLSFLKGQGFDKSSKVLLFPPAYCWETFASHSSVQWGAQNIYHEDTGAFTGENSPEVLSSLGAGYALVGHSERRHVFGETEEAVHKKVQSLYAKDLTPVLCIGETLKERERGKTFDRVQQQIISAGLQAHKALILAYEPVWAIGTGQVATVEQAQEVHHYLRQFLKEKWGEAFSVATPILYGGSVKVENAKALAAAADIDGFLIGRGSLEAQNFLEIHSLSQC